MQAATVFLSGSLPLKSNKSLVPKGLPKPRRTLICPKAIDAASNETSTIDYSSSFSVFRAEACETIGGEACDAEMFPEVKPETKAGNSKVRVGSEEVDRDYMEYNEPKTVFPGEACDDLGGEFCEPDYQEGVYEEKALAK